MFNVSKCGILQLTSHRKKPAWSRHTAVSGSDHTLIFRSVKPQHLISQPSLLLSHATWKQVCSSIHCCALYLYLPRSLCLTLSTSFVLSPFHICSLDSARSLSHIFVLFSVSHSLRFHCFSYLLFSTLPPLRSSLPPPSRWALTPWYSPFSSSSAAAPELSWAHLPQEKTLKEG